MNSLLSTTIPLIPTQTVDGRTVYAKPGTLGCSDCGGSCHQSTLAGPAPEIFDALQNYLLTATGEITFYSKPPGDWFPLVNNELTVKAGRFMGSVVDYRITESGLWLKANAVAPGWFVYDADKVSLQEKSSNVTLSPEMKEMIMLDIFKTVPGAEVVIKTGQVLQTGVETVGKTLDLANLVLKNLPLIAITAAGLIVYVKYGDDIKKAFSKKETKANSSMSGPPKKKLKVIHV